MVKERLFLLACWNSVIPCFKMLLRRCCGFVVVGLRFGTCSCARPSNHIAQSAQLMPINNTSTRAGSITRPRSQSKSALLSPLKPHSCHQRHAYSTKRSCFAAKLDTTYHVTVRKPLRASLYMLTFVRRFPPFQMRTRCKNRPVFLRRASVRNSFHPRDVSTSVSLFARNTYSQRNASRHARNGSPV